MSFSLLAAAREVPDRIALVDQDGALTFGALAPDTARAMAHLEALTHGEARPIAFVAEPRRAALVLAYAALELGWPLVPLHPRWTAEERQRLLHDTGAIEVALDAWQSEAPVAIPPPREIPDDARWLAVLRTSGSTGAAKAAVLSRSAFAASADASAHCLGWLDGDRWLLALPFAHVGGLSVVTRCLHARRTVVLAPAGADPLDVMRAHDVTLGSLVPTQLARLLDRDAQPPPTLRAVLLGGAAASSTLVEKARARGWPVLTTYGLTETCSQLATQRLDRPRGLDDCGPPLPGYEMRCTDGHIEVRTPALLSGYLVDGVLRPIAQGNGWFRTGDLGRFDAEGRLHVLGRADDVIVTGGEKVLPREVEEVLERCAGVRAACVFGVDDPLWGQLVAAAIVAPPELAPVIAENARRSLARHAWPRKVAFVDALAVNASGKVDRRQVRAQTRDVLEPLPRV